MRHIALLVYIYCELLSVMMYASHDGRWVLDGFVRALWFSGRNTVSCKYPPADNVTDGVKRG